MHVYKKSTNIHNNGCIQAEMFKVYQTDGHASLLLICQKHLAVWQTASNLIYIGKGTVNTSN